MLRSQLKLAGVIGLSTYLSLRNEKLLGAANSETPVLLAHGTADQVVRLNLAPKRPVCTPGGGRGGGGGAFHLFVTHVNFRRGGV